MNQTIYFQKNIWEKLKNEEHKSNLINQLLSEHYNTIASIKKAPKTSKIIAKPNHEALFYALVTTLGFTDQVRYTEGRKHKLAARLKSYTAEELAQAAQAIRNDDFMNGDNEHTKHYGDIDYLLRSDDLVDKWLQKNTSQSLSDNMLPTEEMRKKYA